MREVLEAVRQCVVESGALECFALVDRTFYNACYMEAMRRRAYVGPLQLLPRAALLAAFNQRICQHVRSAGREN